MNKHKYSEIFTSIQGEGEYTGTPTVWLRWFLCNLQCSGFGQKVPEDPSTHVLPYEEFDISNIKRIEDLPVWSTGCDSSYSWAKKYRHLCPEGTAEEIADKLEEQLVSMHDKHPTFFNEHSLQYTHFCMTGGEPMMKRTQTAQIELMNEFLRRNNVPMFITVETNGTQPLAEDMAQTIMQYVYSGGEWFWSVSPKLLYTSGEQPAKAIKPEVVKSYQDISPRGQLKFVVSNRKEAWDELEATVKLFRDAGVVWPVWIMPVGATVEAQSDDDMRAVVEETIRRGYKVAARVHCYIWGNKIGT